MELYTTNLSAALQIVTVPSLGRAFRCLTLILDAHPIWLRELPEDNAELTYCGSVARFSFRVGSKMSGQVGKFYARFE